ncbi:hypothetical protein GH714_003179 [Hevea brasiliensis]|uniref:EDR1/CTR1/ARMC3-like peptidase-like domain-containing protein n=1 Tax=Hevea brasiliensis TaxID=3981 RepID=A0A6A6KHM7_HEVBR|nr:hypothetical protein GH714_003179 [Hevea brasiliensis]
MKHIFKKLHIGSSHEPHRSNETPPSPPYTSDPRTAPGNAPASPPSTSSSPVSTVTATTIPPAANNSNNRTDYFSSEEEFQVQLALAISASNSDFKDDPEKDQIRAATLLSLGGNHHHNHHRIDVGREKGEAARRPCQGSIGEYCGLFLKSNLVLELQYVLNCNEWSEILGFFSSSFVIQYSILAYGIGLLLVDRLSSTTGYNNLILHGASEEAYVEYNVLDYEEKVIDGFYDVLSTSPAVQGKMPSLTDLETNRGSSGFEAVIVNQAIDPGLEELVQVSQCIALDCPATDVSILVQRLAELVTGHMGGPVKDANIMLARWMERSTELRTSLHTSVLPIGSINIGLSRHRALLFKVLADNTGLPCRLVKGSHYTGIEDDAINIIKLEDEREFLVDLMADPGTLIPADVLSVRDTTFKSCNPTIGKIPGLHSSSESGIVYNGSKPLLGEGSSQNSSVDGSLPLDRRLSGESVEPLASFSGANSDVGVGSSGVSSRGAPSNQHDIFPPQLLDRLCTRVVVEPMELVML